LCATTTAGGHALGEGRKMTKIDGLDEKIIEFLLREGPVTNLTIATALKTSEATVRRRRTRLESEGVIKFVCAADPAKLGFHSAAIIGIEALASRITSIEAEIKQMDDVQFLGLTTGGYDLMLEVWLRSPNNNIVHFTTEVLARVEGILRVDVFLLTRLSKYSGWSGIFRA
jgi:Lrp/AsnC family transcriptional regulator for asnA, asnC and gidA